MFKHETFINILLCLSLLGLGFLWGYFTGAVTVPNPGLAYCQSLLETEIILGKPCVGAKCPKEVKLEAK